MDGLAHWYGDGFYDWVWGYDGLVPYLLTYMPTYDAELVNMR